MKTIKELMNTLPQVGEVVWIGIRPKRRGTIKVVEEVTVSIEEGLLGDHYSSKIGKRQVTLIQEEHLKVVAALLGKETIRPALTRRNIVVKGINLLALKGKQFQIGDVILEATGNCSPCSRMEENLGEGGYNAIRGHGGITAKVVKDGKINIGSKVSLIKKLT